MSYNGWANYETWNVKLWLDNNGDDEYMRELARENDSEYSLAGAIKDHVTEQNPLAGESSMFADMLNAALNEVRWDDIAKSYWEEVKEEDKDYECCLCGEETDGDLTDSDGDIICEECLAD